MGKFPDGSMFKNKTRDPLIPVGGTKILQALWPEQKERKCNSLNILIVIRKHREKTSGLLTPLLSSPPSTLNSPTYPVLFSESHNYLIFFEWGCYARSSFLHRLFASCAAQASHCSGSSCGTGVLQCSGFSDCGSYALGHRLSSCGFWA